MTHESRSGDRSLRRRVRQALGNLHGPSVLGRAGGDRSGRHSTEVAPATQTAPGSEVISVAEFRRRFEDGELSPEATHAEILR